MKVFFVFKKKAICEIIPNPMLKIKTHLSYSVNWEVYKFQYPVALNIISVLQLEKGNELFLQSPNTIVVGIQIEEVTDS